MKIAYIGFGEAAYNIMKGWSAEGLKNLVAFDANRDHPKKGELIRRRAKEVGVILTDTLKSAYEGADFIFNNTSASCALSIAKRVIPKLKKGQVYLDLNATSPKTKENMDEIHRERGVYFVDVAVMGSIAAKGHKTKMYMSGVQEGVQKFYSIFSSYGMNLHPLDAPAGGASAIKMFKSVFSKGLPQLLLESMLPAAKYGVLDEYMKNIDNTFKGKTVSEYADAVLYRTVIHAERRSHEMTEVVSTLENMGLDASMSKATEARLKLMVADDIPSLIPADAVMEYRNVIDLILNKLNEA
ncbi:DUF1932 domain-containing protein [Acidaminococcus sp. LBK-2]|uniref:NAD(P)-dependent oxidoreductase n=1 Tax=Acidaminococcus sp. LBK-2 TaxID=3456956 RepID=UPI003FA4D466